MNYSFLIGSFFFFGFPYYLGDFSNFGLNSSFGNYCLSPTIFGPDIFEDMRRTMGLPPTPRAGTE